MIEFETRRREPPTINLSALIDIAFILVIFIVLGATFQRVRGVEVDLPSADAKTNPESEALVVTVPRTGPFKFEDREVPEAEVAAALQQARKTHTSVLLLADKEAAVQRALKVLADAQNAGFETVSIAAEPPRGETP